MYLNIYIGVHIPIYKMKNKIIITIFVIIFIIASSIVVLAINHKETNKKEHIIDTEYMTVYDRYGRGYRLTQEQLDLINSPFASDQYKEEILRNNVVCSQK